MGPDGFYCGKWRKIVTVDWLVTVWASLMNTYLTQRVKPETGTSSLLFSVVKQRYFCLSWWIDMWECVGPPGLY